MVSRGIVSSQDFAKWVGELQREIDEKGMYFCFTMAAGEKPAQVKSGEGEGEGKKSGIGAAEALAAAAEKAAGGLGRRLRRRW